MFLEKRNVSFPEEDFSSHEILLNTLLFSPFQKFSELFLLVFWTQNFSFFIFFNKKVPENFLYIFTDD